MLFVPSSHSPVGDGFARDYRFERVAVHFRLPARASVEGPSKNDYKRKETLIDPHEKFEHVQSRRESMRVVDSA